MSIDRKPSDIAAEYRAVYATHVANIAAYERGEVAFDCVRRTADLLRHLVAAYRVTTEELSYGLRRV
jgi:hypothetical protein